MQDTAQMQFMLDISRSVATAYQHLVPNLLTTLTQLALLRRDAYLKHVHNSLDSCRRKDLRQHSVLGQDMFDKSRIQEYEKHLIEMGVKTSSKSRNHPYKKGEPQKRKPRARSKQYQASSYQQVPPPPFVVPHAYYPPPPQGNFRGRSGRRRGHKKG